MPEDYQTLFPVHITEMAEKHSQIELLVKRLRLRSPIRKIAEEALTGIALSPQAVALLSAITQEPSDSRWRERTIAAWALGQQTLPVEQAQIVAQRLGRMLENKQIGKMNRLIRRLFRSGARTLVYLFCLSLFWPMVLGLPGGTLWIEYVQVLLGAFLLILSLGAPFVPFISLGVDVKRNNVARAMAAWSLGRLGVPGTVEALAKTAVTSDMSVPVSIEAARALERVLPRVGVEHYGQLGRRTVPDLCTLLLYSSGARTLRAEILVALEKIGDARAIAPVERLMKYNKGPRVIQAVQKLLLILRERQRQENEPKVLLRASSFEDASGETLLRAASAAVVTDPQQLLRATLNGEPGDASEG